LRLITKKHRYWKERGTKEKKLENMHYTNFLVKEGNFESDLKCLPSL
jgi:hypothetical protein